MKAGKRAGIALSAATMLAASVLAFAQGAIKSPELLDRIQVGVTTSQQVTEILGPPARVEKFARRQVEAWDYRIGRGPDANISIEIDSKGVVRNVQRIVYWGP